MTKIIVDWTTTCMYIIKYMLVSTLIVNCPQLCLFTGWMDGWMDSMDMDG